MKIHRTSDAAPGRVGFIALSGVGIDDAVRDVAIMGLRPILRIALVVALGFLPMALNMTPARFERGSWFGTRS